MTISDQEIANAKVAEDIIEASVTELYNRVFFLGPYARRVSFSSQQNRALNLVWALQIAGRISPGQHIAIVGGGLSGITAAAALLDLGYLITIYEGGDNVMTRQSSADHRFIHPTINLWPEGDLSETTSVPYFDWASAICADLVKEIQTEWGTVSKAEHIRHNFHTSVVDFNESDDEVGVETVEFCDAGLERYAAVLVTSGFADEDYGDELKFPGYWLHDNLERRIGAPENRNLKYLISGCGDGGLIDAIRIAHRAFEKGRLIVDVARSLKDCGWAGLQDIADAEKKLANDRTALASAIASGSDELKRVYEKAVKELPDEVRTVLDRSLRSERGVNFITLLSRERHPFSPMSAPIHKLLIAHALAAKVVRHKSRRVVEFEADFVNVVPAGTPDDKIDETAKEKVKGHVILRHGAQPNFRRFFEENNDVALDLIRRQKLLAANLDRPFWRLGEGKLKDWPPQTNMARELVKRHGRAADIIRKTTKIINGKIDMDEEKGFLFYHDNKPETLAGVSRIPARIFGFDVTPVAEGTDYLSKGKAAGAFRKSAVSPGSVVRPGFAIESALNGRLGALFTDMDGRPVSITAGHLASADPRIALPVNSRTGAAIGVFDDEKRAAYLADHDAALVRLNPDIGLDPAYAGFPAIRSIADAHDCFGEIVFLEKGDGTMAVGYVSATRAGVSFRRPGSPSHIVVRDAIRIRSADPSAPFAVDGDSGAPVVDAEGRLLGIILCNDERYTFALPAKPLAEHLGLTLLTQATGAATGPVEDPTEVAVVAEIIHLYAAANRKDLEETIVDLGDAPPLPSDGSEAPTELEPL